MSRGRQIVSGLILLTIAMVVGTVGYMVIEGANVFDAFYQVAITVSTVGYREEFELSTAGKIWTIVVIVLGLGVALYTAVASIEYLIELRQSRRESRMKQAIDRLSNHVILCGFGRVGRGTWQMLQSDEHVPSVVIDTDTARIASAVEAGANAMVGDATHNDVLIEAGIERAQSVIACVEDDSDNLVIALSAKAIRPEIRVICRATELESERKLRLAGADAVVAPQAVGAERLAMMALQPELAQVFDVIVSGRPVEFRVEELDIAPDCQIVGKSIKDSGVRETSGALILAVESGGDDVIVNPSPEQVLRSGERLVVVGTQQQVDRAAELLRSATS